MCTLCNGRHILRDKSGRFIGHAILRRMRDDWQAYLESMITSAEEFTRGHMLTRRGWQRGVSVLRILTGQSSGAYASEELRDWMRTHAVTPWREYVMTQVETASA